MQTKTQHWNTESWRDFPIKQQPIYTDANALKSVEEQLRSAPALTSPNEARSLKAELADAANGKAFLLQGGDCAESFAEFSEENLKRYFRVMLQMTMALMYGSGTPVVKVGRIAGQFSKPRSENTEKKDGVELPVYRGDMVNGMEFDEATRLPDPERLLKVYYQGAATLNFLRTLARGGYASLSRINKWNMEFAQSSAQGKRFEELIERINECIGFIKACRLPIDEVEQFSEASFYTSHEALLLGYESSLTRLDKAEGKYYAGSAHMLWIGDRTRNLDGARAMLAAGELDGVQREEAQIFIDTMAASSDLRPDVVIDHAQRLRIAGKRLDIHHRRDGGANIEYCWARSRFRTLSNGKQRA